MPATISFQAPSVKRYSKELEILNLSHNCFTGVPDFPSVPGRLSELKVNDNCLEGEVQLVLRSTYLSVVSLRNNPGLHGTVKKGKSTRISLEQTGVVIVE